MRIYESLYSQHPGQNTVTYDLDLRASLPSPNQRRL